MDKSRDAPPDRISFRVHADPKGKGRPRFSRDRFGRVHTRTPDATVDFEDRIRAAYLEQGGAARQRPAIPAGVPIRMQVEIFFAPPKGTTKKKALEMCAGRIRPTKRPDIDNVLKAVADALNGLAYVDDAQIVEMTASKRYDAVEGILVEISQV